MSVINKMLQDLENRESDTQSINADYQPPEAKSSKKLILVLILVAIVAILYALFIPVNNIKDSHVVEPKTTAEVATITPKPKQMLSQPIKQTVINQPRLATKPETLDKIPNEKPSEVQVEAVVESPKNSEITANNDPLPIAKLEIEQLESNKPVEIDQPEKVAVDTTSFKMTNSNQATKLVDLKQQISEHLAQGNNTQASALLTLLIKQQPHNIKARKKLASIYFAQGNHNQAKLLLNQGIELFPARSDLSMMLARIFVIQDNPEEALQALLAPEIESKGQEFLAYRAALAQQLKRTDLAREDYLALTKLNPNSAKWWLGLGIIEDQSGNRTQALNAYKHANQGNQLEAKVLEFIQQRIVILAESK